MLGIGLNHGEINSSAALIKNSVIVAAAPEERFNRQKLTKAFPKGALQYCLRHTPSHTLSDCDFVAQAWNPGTSWHKYNPIISSARTKREDYFYSIPDHLYNFSKRQPREWIKMDFDDALPPLYFVQHHRAHAANAFFLSNLKEAAILTADWRGEYESITMSIGRDNQINLLQTENIPNSLGMFYATFTELLGYQPDNEEWKVMALSAFNADCTEHLEQIRKTFRLLPNGRLELDQSYYKGAILDQPHLATDKLVTLLGGKRGAKGDELSKWSLSIAKAMQITAEEIATHLLNHLYQVTQCESVALGGGFFMNCVFNGKVISRTPFKNVYISFAPSDVGNSIGSALYVNHVVLNQPRNYEFTHSYLGPEFTEHDALTALKRRGIKFEQMEHPEPAIADLINQGAVLAHFNGKMEFGDRALGNRSILADPRRAEMKDKVNSIIKYRESYRPFAPAITTDDVQKYFEVPGNYTCHYMEKVAMIREQFRHTLAGVTHVDGSGRVQTVTQNHNPRFYGIIKEFEKITGIPIILNTSFNVAGEPIVCTPDDAITTFFNSGLDYLVIGNILVRK